MRVNLRKPTTFKGVEPADMIGQYVRVRPYYHVPSGPSSFSSARSPFTFAARVVEPFGSETVVVRFTFGTGASWDRAYYPRELHQMGCTCPACAWNGDGIHRRQGA